MDLSGAGSGSRGLSKAQVCRGFSIRVATNPDAPPTKCTGPQPATSIAPICKTGQKKPHNFSPKDFKESFFELSSYTWLQVFSTTLPRTKKKTYLTGKLYFCHLIYWQATHTHSCLKDKNAAKHIFEKKSIEIKHDVLS